MIGKDAFFFRPGQLSFLKDFSTSFVVTIFCYWFCRYRCKFGHTKLEFGLVFFQNFLK